MDAFIRAALDRSPLDPDAERELVDRSRAGDRRARDELVLAGLRPVAQHALMVGARGDALHDAVQAGMIAWMDALRRYDPDRGVRLATYAWAWVRGAVLTELRRSRIAEEWPAEIASRGQDESAEDWLTGLHPVAADVIRLRYGVRDGLAPMSRRATARRLALSESAVRRIEAEAMRQLRGRLARIVTRAPEVAAPVPYSSIGRAADC